LNSSPDKEQFSEDNSEQCEDVGYGNCAKLPRLWESCVAGGAYLPIMSDEAMMRDARVLFLAGSSLSKAAIGESS